MTVQNSEQVSYYFLYHLDMYRLYVRFSEQHWMEELEKYSHVDTESHPDEFIERYDLRTDLHHHFESEFPQYHRQSSLVMLLSKFEDYLNQLCVSLKHEKELTLAFKEMRGSGIERAKFYLVRVAGLTVPSDGAAWQQLMKAQNIRNVLVHNAAHLEKQSHSKQIKYVENSSDLQMEQFARLHLTICLLYTSPSPRDQRGSRMPSSA